MCHTRQHTSSCICVPYLEEIIIRVKSKCNKRKKKMDLCLLNIREQYSYERLNTVQKIINLRIFKNYFSELYRRKQVIENKFRALNRNVLLGYLT